MSIEEKGPFTVLEGRNEFDVFVSSEDFTHDVLMKITGDFSSYEEKIEYAEYICAILNERNHQ